MYWHRNPWRVRRMRPYHMRRWFWGRPRGWRPYHRRYRGCGCLPFLLIPLMVIGATAFFGFLSWFMW